MLYELYQRARNIAGIPNDTNAIVRRTYDSPREMFSYLAYPKGGWVLHMLRSQLGEDLYRRCIKTYLERHQFDNVVTEDLRAVIEELSGRSYDQFFDQWLYHAHHPELEVNYSWDEKNKLAKVTLKQTQSLSENVLLFHFPLAIRFKGKFGAMDRQVQVKDKEEDFYFPLPEAPQIVRLDPEYTLLAKIKFETPNPMLDAQLADKDDAIGRLLAIEQLSAKEEVQEALLKFLNAASYRNELADAAIAGLRSQDDPASIAPLIDTLSEREADFTSRGFGQGLTTLAYLARNEEKKDRVREFLT